MLLGVVRINTKKVAFGGLMTAMSVMVLYLSSVLPTLKLTACVISSVIVCIAMLKSGYLTATLVYVASAVVSLVTCDFLDISKILCRNHLPNNKFQ